jgi:hypothetical protein
MPDVFAPSLADIVELQRLPVANFMPPEGEPFEFASYVALPAIGANARVVSFLVPPGRNGMIKRLANVFVGGGFQEGQGGVVWKIFLDFTQAIVAPNFENIVASLGSVSAPSVVDGIRVREGQLVVLQVNNISIGVAGQLIGGRLGGYFYPKEFDQDTAGF